MVQLKLQESKNLHSSIQNSFVASDSHVIGGVIRSDHSSRVQCCSSHYINSVDCTQFQAVLSASTEIAFKQFELCFHVLFSTRYLVNVVKWQLWVVKIVITLFRSLYNFKSVGSLLKCQCYYLSWNCSNIHTHKTQLPLTLSIQ